MNEVFEKILEQLEELQNNLLSQTEGDVSVQVGIINGVMYSKKIVQEVAEEYNDGWIACSERLPEEAFGCLVTVMDCNPSTQTDFENILPYVVGYDGHGWNDADGEEIPFEVLAWRKLPLPYQPKGE